MVDVIRTVSLTLSGEEADLLFQILDYPERFTKELPLPLDNVLMALSSRAEPWNFHG